MQPAQSTGCASCIPYASVVARSSYIANEIIGISRNEFDCVACVWVGRPADYDL
jgi:hypothetical protein